MFHSITESFLIRTTKLVALAGLLLVLLTASAPNKASADAWSYDLSFGFLGRSVTDVGGLSNSYANDIITLSNGDLLAAGVALSNDNSCTQLPNSNTVCGRSFALARYKPNGFLDPNFGNGGQVVTKVLDGTADARINAVTELPNGDIVAVGQVFDGNQEQIALARYHSNGSLDTSFTGENNGNGIVLHQPSNGGFSRLEDVIPGPNGDILAAGTVKYDGAERSALIRYTSAGKVNLSFDGNSGSSNGVVLADFTVGQKTYTGYGKSLVKLQNGNVAVAGYAIDLTNDASNFAVSLYNPNTGALDSGFGSEGFAITPVGDGSKASAETAYANGDGVLLGGAATDAGISRFALASYKADGTLDSNFDGDGKTVLSVGSNGISNITAIVPWNGEPVAVGSAIDNGLPKVALVKFTTNGAVDSSFAQGGVALLQVFSGTNDQISYANGGVNNGQIVTAGNTLANNASKFALMRYGLNPIPPETTSSTNNQSTRDSKPPTTKINKPKGSARKLKKITGKATDSQSKVSQVEVNLVRKRGKQCFAYKGNKLKKLTCKAANSTWIGAQIGSKSRSVNWSLKVKLPAGSYTIRARATDTAGNVQKVFAANSALVKFSLKR